MHNILLVDPNDRPFDAKAIERVFQSEPGFSDVRYNEPGGAYIEAEYVLGDYRTIARLSDNCDTISLSGTSDAALQAALILQKNLHTPLRMVDTDYSFDLILSSLSSIEELQAAIDAARSS